MLRHVAFTLALFATSASTAWAGQKCIKSPPPPPSLQPESDVEFVSTSGDADVHASGLWHRRVGGDIKEGNLAAAAHRTFTAFRTSGAASRLVVACLDALIADPKHATACAAAK
jgi:hypothetical protein